MYKLFYLGDFVGEFETMEAVEQEKRAIFDEAQEKAKEDFALLKEMDEALKDIFPKPAGYSRQQYRDFVTSRYPEFFGLLKRFAERRTEEDIVDIFFREPNGNNVGLKVKKEDSPRGYTLKSLNTYYLQLANELPHSVYSFKVTAKSGDKELTYTALRGVPRQKENAAKWFHSKWGVPEEAYLACMDEYLDRATEYGWYLCMDGEKIIGGLGVIENDFHDRKDLAPNVCAVYTEEDYRGGGIAGRLLDMAVTDMRDKGISPVYLVTDHEGFYERYGWEFLCKVQGDGEADLTRMYIHR